MKRAPFAPEVGAPVNPILGAKILAGDEDLDFSLEGPLPFDWQRSYRSTNSREGWFGRGWSSPLEIRLESVPDPGRRVVDHLELIDPFGRQVRFPALETGASAFSTQEKATLSRLDDDRYQIELVDGTRWWFGRGDDRTLFRLVAISDRNDNTIRLTYEGQPTAPRVVRVACSGGQVLELRFDRGRLTAVVESRPESEVPSIVLVRYEFTSGGELSRVFDRAGKCVRAFEYDSQRRMSKQVYAGVFEASYWYESDGPAARVARHADNSGRSWRFTYGATQTSVIDQDDRVTVFHFDADRRWTGYTDAEGRHTRRGIDRAGNLRAVIDPVGRATEIVYDERGRPTEYHRPDGATTTIVWHADFALPILITDPLGRTTRYEYDERGNLVAETDPAGAQTRYEVDGRGLATTVIDANGGVRRLEYNRRCQVVRHVDCSGRETRFEYDADGRLSLAVNAASEATRYEYDAAGRLSREVWHDGSSIGYEHDVAGRVIATTNSLGQRTQYRFHCDGQLDSETDPLGGRLTYRYDRSRRLVAIVNENGDVHEFEYDSVDRLIAERRFDRVLIRHRYDASGYLVETVEGADTQQAIVTSYVRDEAGRIVERTTGNTRSTFDYDAAGQMIRAVDHHSGVRTDLQYDAAGRVIAEVVATRERSFTTRKEYDSLGNPLTTKLPSAREVRTLYYGSGHAHRLLIDRQVVTDFERDALHREVSRTQGTLTSYRRYDRAGRLERQTASPARGDSTPIVDREYRYDAAGRLVGLGGPLGSISVGYDALDRLEQFGDERFTFDSSHNPTSPPSRGRVEGNRLVVYQDKRYTYDVHGRVVEKRVGAHTVVALEWDDQHRLVASTTRRGGGTTTTQYLHDPFGRRIAKRNNGETVWFVWDGDALVEQANGHASTTFLYEPGTFVPLALVTASEAASPASEAICHYHCDQIGLPRELTDAQGRLRWRATYKAWGRVQGADSPVEPGVPQPLRFQGQYFDDETGLHYNRHRYYDPDIGRFISQDPIGLTGGTNPYEYAPNPLTWIDPWGLAVVEATFKMAGRRYTGRNPTDRARRSSGRTPRGLRGPNTDRCDMHAEIEAMVKAYDKGLRGGEATLTITGLPACPYCTGDVKTMARKLRLDKLTVNNNGQTVVFTKEDLKPIKEGGKGWKCG